MDFYSNSATKEADFFTMGGIGQKEAEPAVSVLDCMVVGSDILAARDFFPVPGELKKLKTVYRIYSLRDGKSLWSFPVPDSMVSGKEGDNWNILPIRDGFCLMDGTNLYLLKPN